MSDDAPVVQAEIGWICIDCADPEGLAAWWQRLVGGSVSVDDDGDVHLDGGPVPLLFLRVLDTKVAKNRLHLDLRVHDYDSAVARAVALGARLADEIYVGERWRVLRDPEGNEFCIIRPKPGD